MPIALAALDIFLDVLCIVHLIKTGRDRMWFYLIIFLPLVGAIAYFFMEMLPDMTRSPEFKRAKANLKETLNPGQRLRELQERAEMTPSVEMKKELAKEYVNNSMFPQAIAVYEDCRKGVHANDESILEGLSLAHYFNNDHAKAQQALAELFAHRDKTKCDEFNLLQARILEETGDTPKALDEYRCIANRYPGEEARCRYAMLLKQQGMVPEADKVFAEVLRNARHSPGYYRKTQSQWIRMARQEMGKA